MVTLQNMPEEIKKNIFEHGLVRSESFADEHQVGIQLALTRTADLVMNSFAELAEQPSGREVLWNAARETEHAEAPRSNGTAVAPQRGAGLVKSVLDDRYHGTLHTIATAAGVQTSSVAQLINVVTAAALDIMGGLVAENRWNAWDLGQWLRSRQVVPAAAVPAAGLSSEPIAMEAAPVAGATGWVATHANALLLAVGVVAVAEFGYIIGTRPGSTDATEAATYQPAPATNGPGQYAAMPVSNLSEPAAATSPSGVPVVLKLKNGLRQIIGANSTESKLYQFLIDPSKEVDLVDARKGWIGFDRIYFESSKAVLTNESLWQLSNVASILKRFPAAKVKVGGYTDSSGNPYLNLKLSQERAKSAMTTLISMGVPADHLLAVGYGALDSLASNATEEGRSLNRRVSLQVTQK